MMQLFDYQIELGAHIMHCLIPVRFYFFEAFDPIVV